ncbi:YecA family protein [Roseateles sp. SL47]|nr:YecA family protein [Roseateles sp. SL47]WAC75764.1 YecA family protein [Roseateles sp. SL47]
MQSLLDEVAEHSEPLDVSMLDGFLVGVLLQPKPVALSDWWPWVLDSEGGQSPDGVEVQALLAQVQRRYGELRQAITDRQWFDPWVFELDEEASPSDTVLPWVAGFALAADLFPGLMSLDESELTEPLAQLYMHLDPEDLEDADALLEEIESLEPPEELDEAVESLVRATLLLADVSRPRVESRGGARSGTRPGGRVEAARRTAGAENAGRRPAQRANSRAACRPRPVATEANRSPRTFCASG